jgi:hypothetical protein
MRYPCIFVCLLAMAGAQIVQAAELPQWQGFVETAYGGRLHAEGLPKHARYNMLEQRLQLKTRYALPGDNAFSRAHTVLNVKGDFLIDEYFDTTGSGELRECNIAFSPTPRADIKLGRQVLTWGTGDYLFINDLFPKDYVSFYIGRDDEYLKKPSDALRISMYPEFVNIDFAAIGHFTPNTLPEGDRVSFFDSFQAVLPAATPIVCLWSRHSRRKISSMRFGYTGRSAVQRPHCIITAGSIRPREVILMRQAGS